MGMNIGKLNVLRLSLVGQCRHQGRLTLLAVANKLLKNVFEKRSYYVWIREIIEDLRKQ